MSSVHLDSFSGSAIDLPRGKRSEIDVLRALFNDPRVSCWDRGARWLDSAIRALQQAGLIAEQASYPWYRYALTDAGLNAIAGAKDHA
jgi:hypothetical protein